MARCSARSCPAAGGGGGVLPAAAAAAAPATASSSHSLQREAAVLRRWLHTHGSGGSAAWQHACTVRQQQQQQQPWLRVQQAWRPAGAAADARQLCLRRWMSERPRGPKDLQGRVGKRVADQGWYIVSWRLESVARRTMAVWCRRAAVKTQPHSPSTCAAPSSTPLQLAVAVGMVGMTYAAVPLYRMFCQVGWAARSGGGVWRSSHQLAALVALPLAAP